MKDAAPQPHASKQLNVALAGNPNAGKTTLFNALTGLHQKVANYPGVTVERKHGVIKLIDLPGLYSLEATSLDEQIASDVLLGKIDGTPKPDAVIAVVDATNLERNLYLVTQLFEYGIPVVACTDVLQGAHGPVTHAVPGPERCASADVLSRFGTMGGRGRK